MISSPPDDDNLNTAHAILDALVTALNDPNTGAQRIADPPPYVPAMTQLATALALHEVAVSLRALNSSLEGLFVRRGPASAPHGSVTPEDEHLPKD